MGFSSHEFASCTSLYKDSYKDPLKLEQSSQLFCLLDCVSSLTLIGSCRLLTRIPASELCQSVYWFVQGVFVVNDTDLQSAWLPTIGWSGPTIGWYMERIVDWYWPLESLLRTDPQLSRFAVITTENHDFHWISTRRNSSWMIGILLEPCFNDQSRANHQIGASTPNRCHH
jgi:hypothetical protein